MMVDLRRGGRGPHAPRGREGRAALVLLAALVAASAGRADTVPEDVVPDRSPQPRLGDDPWPGFRPDAWIGPGAFPLAPVADPDRWAGLPDSTAPIPAPTSVRPAPPAGFHETPEFEAGWTEARSRARKGDAAGVIGGLAGLEARTRTGTDAVRRLAFAAWVTRGGRAAADSLFYRLPPGGADRAGSRLAAWRAIEAGDPAGVRRALEPAADAGAAAALAWADWFAGARGREAPPAGDAEGTARVLLDLARAREALLAGDAGGSASALPPETVVPEAWREVRRALLAGIDGEAGEASDAEALRQAIRSMEAGDDADALAAVNPWFGRWPDSPHRGDAYFLRAQIHLRARDADAAALDLRAAERGAHPACAAWLPLLHAWVDALRGRHEEADTAVDRLLAGPLGATAEPELLFNRFALLRLGRDEEGARAVRLLLEEAFPESPYTARTAEEGPAPHPIVTPLAERGPADVPAPRRGPWGRVLFGDRVLEETAAALSDRPGFAPEEEAVERVLPAPATGVGSWWGGSVALGVGARATGFGEAGFSGRMGSLGARVRAEGLRTQEPGALPLSRRGGVETGVSLEGESWTWSLVAERSGRRESDPGGAGVGGFLPAGPVAADWFGGRLDIRRTAESRSGIDRIQGAWVGGNLAAGAGRWQTAQQWVSIDGRRPAPGGRFEARFSLARLEQRQTDRSGTDAVFPDLRVTRRFASGVYVGGRAALYRDRGLLLPVAGIERTLPAGWQVWAASEPSLEPTPFRETFVAGGDWNVPEFTLPAQRRDLDLRGGVRREGRTLALSGGAEWFRAGSFRTWREDAGLWVEDAVEHASGTRVHASARVGGRRGFRFSIETSGQRIRADGSPVPFVPEHTARARVRYAVGPWHVGASVLGVRGRRDGEAREYGEFLRWDCEVSHRGSDRIEYSVRIENLGNSADQRWPGFPSYGRGIFGGVRYLLGS